MAFGTHLQSTGEDAGTVTTKNLAFGSNNGGGNILVMVARVGIATLNSVTSVSDTQGNVWNRAKSSLATGDHDLETWIALNSKPGANTVTINLPSSTLRWVIAEYEGSPGAVVGPSSNSGSASSTALDSGAITPARASTLLLGANSMAADSLGLAATNSFTEEQEIVGRVQLQDRILSAIVSVNSTATAGSASQWAAQIIEINAGLGMGMALSSSAHPGRSPGYAPASFRFWQPVRPGAGTVSPDLTLALTGVASVGSPGTLGVSRTKPITGVSETSAVGTVKANLTKALSGLSTTTAVGTLGVTRAKAISGVSSVTARGTLTSSRTVSLAGVQALSAVGTVALPGDVTVALTGVSATGTVGTLTATVESSDALPVSKFRYIIRGKAKLHKSSHREMAELLDRVFSTPDAPSVPAPLVEQVAAIVKPFVSKNELNLGKLYKDMKATRELLAVWEAETARMRVEDEDDDETVLLMS